MTRTELVVFVDDYIRKENESYSYLDAIDISVPQEVNSNIKSAIQSFTQKKSFKKHLANFVGIAASVVVFFGAVFTVNVEAKEKVWNLIRSFTSSSVEYTPIHPVEENTSVRNFELGWLPEGYEFESEKEYSFGTRQVYKKGEDSIVVTCYTIGAIDYIGVSHSPEEGQGIRQGIICGNNYDFIYADSLSRSNNLIVTDEQNNVIISIASILDEDEIIKIYEKIILK